jgi:hypothetical protein
MKQEFEMSYAEMDKIICINKANSNTVMMVGGVDFSNNLTEAINAYWKILADKYGFEWNTVEGSSKGKLFFLAESKPIVAPKTQSEIEIDKYIGNARGYLNYNVKESLQKIVTQLEKCGYECEGGVMKMNIAFLALKELAKTY